MTSIALDQSTSATKALLVDHSGSVVAVAARSHVQYYPQAGWVEHDAEEIWRNTLDAVAEVLTGWQGEAPSFLSITNQRETIVVWDRRTGRPIRPAIVWQCLRSAALCEDLAHAGHSPDIERITGLKLNPYFSGSKLSWLMKHEPETARLIRDGEALVGTMDSYLIYRFTKGEVHATDATNASRTLLMDLSSQSWNPHLVDLFEVPATCLPQIRACDSVYGETDLGGLCPKMLPICGVIGDAQGALLAQKCLKKGDAKATLGTGTFLLVQAGEERPSAETPLLTSVAWRIKGRTNFCLEGLSYISGAVFVWLRDQAGLIADVSEAGELAAQVESSEGVFLVPAFTGLGPPSWRADARAALMGMTLGTTKAHLLRAAFESIAYPVCDQLEVIQSMGIPAASLKLDGGASANEWLVQLMADLCQTDMIVSPDPNASALGAWSAGRIGMDQEMDLDDLPDRDGGRTKPRMSLEEALKRRKGWRAAVQGVIAASEGSLAG